MPNEKSPHGAGTPVGDGDAAVGRHSDFTALEAKVAQLTARVDSLEREMKRLKRPEPDWSQHVLRDPERWCDL